MPRYSPLSTAEGSHASPAGSFEAGRVFTTSSASFPAAVLADCRWRVVANAARATSPVEPVPSFGLPRSRAVHDEETPWAHIRGLAASARSTVPAAHIHRRALQNGPGDAINAAAAVVHCPTRCRMIDDDPAKEEGAAVNICRGLSGGVWSSFGFGCGELILVLIFRGQHALSSATRPLSECSSRYR